MKNYLLCLFAFLLISFYSCNSEDVEIIETQQTVDNLKTRSSDNNELELRSSDLDLMKVLDSFKTYVLRTQTDNLKYPDYYGGAYVNDKGRLVILVTEKHGYYKQIFRSILDKDDFLVQKCNYSYNQLNKCMDEINQYRELNSTSFMNISNFYYVSDIDNKVYVTLKDFNENEISKFKKNINSFAGIEFIKSFDDITLAADINPGMPVVSTSQGASSVGFRAKQAGLEGIVVSGHSIKKDDRLQFDLVNNTTYIGISNEPKVGGSVDCAFVPVDLGTPSNLIYGTTNVLSPQTSSPGATTYVNFRGRHTSDGGNIVSINASASIPSKLEPGKVYNFSNIVSVKLPNPVQDGDSGGIVYSYTKSTNTRYNVGTIVAYSKTSGLSFYTKTTETIKALGITLY